ncbi:RNA polymerase sigma factor [Haloferula rosea]|uniref:Sigma-70 family RNA polymerase sigma factor n=1 Tax=Haloferula rosea TaxID=490093 RepID=A0A934RIR5_9BACT|nr:sigma-70 family RNA polymerase sigma factor [Haloferula rosea]MBK1829020.1 sigma-70 family RNA polymerase sigma factor [Haloferula rosea]
MPAATSQQTGEGGGFFPNTRWSMVIATRDSTSDERGEALEELCRLYWKPVYLFVRQRGNSPEETEDLTQAFFYRVIEGDLLSSIQGPERGRLRSFLCVVLKRFLADDYHRRMALKRGGGQVFVDIDGPSVEGQIEDVRREVADPERAFDRQWALDLLDEARRRLKNDYQRADKEGLFEQFEPAISPQLGRISHAALAERLGISEGAVKVAVHRFRQRYRQCLLSALKDTLAEGEDPEEELRYLLSLFSRG